MMQFLYAPQDCFVDWEVMEAWKVVDEDFIYRRLWSLDIFLSNGTREAFLSETRRCGCRSIIYRALSLKI